MCFNPTFPPSKKKIAAQVWWHLLVHPTRYKKWNHQNSRHRRFRIKQKLNPVKERRSRILRFRIESRPPRPEAIRKTRSSSSPGGIPFLRKRSEGAGIPTRSHLRLLLSGSNQRNPNENLSRGRNRIRISIRKIRLKNLCVLGGVPMTRGRERLPAALKLCRAAHFQRRCRYRTPRLLRPARPKVYRADRKRRLCL